MGLSQDSPLAEKDSPNLKTTGREGVLQRDWRRKGVAHTDQSGKEMVSVSGTGGQKGPGTER